MICSSGVVEKMVGIDNKFSKRMVKDGLFILSWCVWFHVGDRCVVVVGVPVLLWLVEVDVYSFHVIIYDNAFITSVILLIIYYYNS